MPETFRLHDLLLVALLLQAFLVAAVVRVVAVVFVVAVVVVTDIRAVDMEVIVLPVVNVLGSLPRSHPAPGIP